MRQMGLMVLEVDCPCMQDLQYLMLQPVAVCSFTAETEPLADCCKW